MTTLRIGKPEMTRVLLSSALEKLPLTRRGEGYYIEDSHRRNHVEDLIAVLREADTLGWGSYEYKPIVGDHKRYEIAQVIIDHHMSELRFATGGKRLAKNAKEQFVDDLVADFQRYGFFNQQRKELAHKVAAVLLSE